MKDHLLQVKIAIDFYFQSYENIVLISDFNIMLCYVMWKLFTLGSLQFCNDSRIASLETNIEISINIWTLSVLFIILIA